MQSAANSVRESSVQPVVLTRLKTEEWLFVPDCVGKGGGAASDRHAHATSALDYTLRLSRVTFDLNAASDHSTRRHIPSPKAEVQSIPVGPKQHVLQTSRNLAPLIFDTVCRPASSSFP